ncbi:G protein-activated inward rectifier potassium channel 2-like [Bicyclus anynana]|uniref:G protein-activated inward rectifier potassium channel 2-like n=1 Tax=Bicyclus anynana TaxID=110368 RepID=A0A6J1MTT8_BICAN|nr:G protein-activated inward rectifier potassium channel 2-like [Bicyclus anynana]
MKVKRQCFCSESSNDVEDVNPNTALVQPGVYHPKNSKIMRSKNIRRKYLRAVFKSGEFNIYTKMTKNFKIFSNYFFLLVETRWRWTLLNFFVAYTCVWLLFGVIYWIISYNHDDFSEIHLPHNQNISSFTPCINNIYGFTSAFLFSIEIHTTVAYGRRSITLECPETIMAMCLQCILSSIFQAIMIGILFAKLTRPRGRTQTILFSKHAVINMRNDKLCLTFRVGDIRKSRILNIEPKAYVIRFNAGDSEVDNLEQTELKVVVDECESTFFLWPSTAVHVIDEKSPLYRLSAADLLCCKLEILVVFEGIIESTGQPVQARSSFTEHDLLWGHRFVSMVSFNFVKKMYDVDFSKLSEVQAVDTPLCSPCEYNELLALLEDDKALSNFDFWYK